MQATPHGKGRMAEVDTQVLARLLKMLERNVRAGEDVDPFHYVAPIRMAGINTSPSKRSPKKQSRGKKSEPRSMSKTPDGEQGEDDGNGHADNGASTQLTEADFDKLTKALEAARDSTVAADCCIALLGSDRLQKQVCFFLSSSPFISLNVSL